MAVRDLEEYDEVVQKFVELLPPEKVVRAFTPEKVMRAFTSEEVLLALPDEILFGLSEDFVARLPEATRSVIRKRLGR